MSRWYTLHIKNEILFWFFLLALAPLFFLSYINYEYQVEKYKQDSKKYIKLVLENELKSIDNTIELFKKEIVGLAEREKVKVALQKYDDDFKGRKNISLTEYEHYFENIVSQKDVYDLFLINKDGDIVYSVKKESDYKTNLKSGMYSKTNLANMFKNSLMLLETVFSDFEFYLPSNDQAAFVATPIYSGGTLLGILALQIDQKKITNVLEQYVDGLGQSAKIYAAKMDDKNNIIAVTSLDNLQKNSSYHFLNDTSLPIYKAVHGESGIDVLKDYMGKEVLAAWGYLPTLRLGVVTKVDLDELLLPAYQLRFYSLAILFFVALGIVIAILIAIKHIVEPIEKLTVGVKNFANGDIKSDVDIDINNEIGELSKNFNDMAHSLKLSQETIQNYAGDLEEKVKRRTYELENAKAGIEKSNAEMSKYLDIINRHVITSSTDTRGVITKVSQAFCDITGYTKEELIGKRHNIIRHPDMSNELYQDMWKTISSGQTWFGEIKNQRKDGNYYWVKSSISPVFDTNGNIIEYTSIREDITDKKIIEKLSITDQLTQLYNRVKLEDVFNEEIQRAKRYNTSFSVILLDIDHFKKVNDTYGHDIGDETLKDVAKILKESVRVTDVVGRWGGEEFLVISGDTSMEEMLVLAEKIRANIEQHTFKMIGTKTSSFGVSSYKDGDTQESIVKRADEALYEAKHSGRNCVKYIIID